MLTSSISPRATVGGAVILLVLLFTYLSSRATNSASTWHPSSSSSSSSLDGTPRDGRDTYDDIGNQTLGFQKIYAISLPSRTDHRDSLALAAHFTGIKIDFVDGVTQVDDKTLPPRPADKKLLAGEIKSWRAHLNVARLMVEQDIQTALVFEDDLDWDIRLKSQLQDFARASRHLLQPRAGTTDQFFDPTHFRKGQGDTAENLYPGAPIVKPTTSPYGDTDRWDVLWLGHCGVRFPDASVHDKLPLGRAVLTDDQTVPERQHLSNLWGSRDFIDDYPEHTRIVSAPHDATCTLAYALTLSSARRLLYEFGIRQIDDSFDLLLRHICQGTHGRPLRPCLTSQPALFQLHRLAGNKTHSDIQSGGSQHISKAFTYNVRLSTQVNFPILVEGKTNYVDQLPDGAPRPGWV